MKGNLLLIHGGGPTAVLNASLYGAVKEARRHQEVGYIYGARNGTGGVLREEFLDLTEVSEERLKLLLKTPGSAIGTSRDILNAEAYEKMAEIVRKHRIRWVLFNGGNGTMDACGKFCQACEEKRISVQVMGIPKTMDNDIAVTDHSPGYGSAARYLAQSVREVCADVQSLPIHVVVVEALGRNAGWVTAAASLAGDEGMEGPDLIYLPEQPFEEKRYLEDVSRILKRKTGLVVVASEGLKDREGNPIVDPVFQIGRSTYFGDVSSHLANLVIKKLGYKARSEKPGLLGRASVLLQSPVDRQEAILAGELACKAVFAGESKKMVAFSRKTTDPYVMEPFMADIREVMIRERKLPREFLMPEGNGVTEEFRRWCRPLLGGPLDSMISFTDNLHMPGGLK